MIIKRKEKILRSVNNDKIKVKGKITDILPNMKFKVLLENNIEITAYLGGKMKINNIKILMGDGVDVELSPYDLTKGRIVYRYK